MSRRPHRTTTRATVRRGLVTTAVTTALAAGLGALLIFRSVALHETESFLGRQAQIATQVATRAQRFFLGPHGERAFGPRRLLQVGPSGHLLGPVPHDLASVVLRSNQLRPGTIVDVVRGDTVWVLDVVVFSTSRIARTWVVVLHRSVPSELAPALFVVGFTLLAALLAVLVADAYTRRVSSALTSLAKAAEEVSRGQLAADIPPTPFDQAELEELRVAFANMLASLNAASERQTSFLLAISHDLRTPLTSIRGFAEALEDGAVDAQRAAGVIRQETQRIERLLADLMSLARLERDGFGVTLGEVEIEPLLAHLAETARLAGRPRGLQCNLELGPGASLVIADAERLAQALRNVVDNAVKFAASAITITARRRLDTVRIEVSDDGPGVDPRLLGDLFRRQVAPRPGQNQQIGSGLGLLIVARLVEGMGGRVGIRSPIREQRGTTVVIELATARTPASSATP